jgi:glutamate carboxypeptidase
MLNERSIQQYLQDNLDRYLDILRQMVEINSFTANPQGVNALGELSAELFKSLDFQAEFIQSTCAGYGRHLFLTRTAQRRSEDYLSPTVGLISHLDTVFPLEEERQNHFAWRKEGNHIYGPGTVDIKGGTVLIFMVLEAISKFAPQVFDRANWLVSLDASEEQLSEDFARLCLQRFPADTVACLIFEGGNLDDEDFLLVTARKGRAAFRVSVEGRSAHAGNNHAQGANAIVQIAHTIQRISTLTDYSRQLTFNVGTVSGGVVVNRVPHFAEARVEMRTFSPIVFEEGLEKMLALSQTSDVTSEDGFTCRVAVELLNRSEPWPSNESTERLYANWHETASELGMKVKQEERGGLSDGNYLWEHMPTLDGLGPAGNNAHCAERDPAHGKDQEYVSVPSIVPKAVLNTMAIIHLLEKRNQP